MWYDEPHRLSKEVHLPDLARRDKQGKNGDRVDCNAVDHWHNSVIETQCYTGKFVISVLVYLSGVTMPFYCFVFQLSTKERICYLSYVL